MVSQLLLTPIIARIYGPEAYGIYGLYTALVLNITSFTDLGYSIAYVLPKDEERFMHLFRLNITLLMAIVAGTSLIALFKEPLYGLMPSWRPLGSFIHWVPVGVITFSSSVFFTQWLTRKKAFNTSVMIGSTATISLRGFNLVYGLIFNGGLYGLLIGDLVVNGAATLAYGMVLIKHGLGQLFRGWSWKGIWDVAIEYKRYPLLTFPERWVSLLGMQLPVFLLIDDPVIVGQFALSSSLLMIPLRVLGYSFSTVFIQKAAATVDTDPELLGRLTKGLYLRLFWVGVIPFVSLIFFADRAFAAVLGEAWRASGVITGYLGLFFLFRLISEPMVTIFYVQRREHMLLIFQIALTVARLLAMLLFLDQGAAAVILSFAATSAVGYLVLSYLLLRAVGVNAATLTLRTVLFTISALLVLALVRNIIFGSFLPVL